MAGRRQLCTGWDNINLCGSKLLLGMQSMIKYYADQNCFLPDWRGIHISLGGWGTDHNLVSKSLRLYSERVGCVCVSQYWVKCRCFDAVTINGFKFSAAWLSVEISPMICSDVETASMMTLGKEIEIVLMGMMSDMINYLSIGGISNVKPNRRRAEKPTHWWLTCFEIIFIFMN